MSIENRPEQGPIQVSWENVLEEIDTSRKKGFFITELNRFRGEYSQACKEQGTETLIKAGGVKTFIEKKIPSEDLLIRGYAEIGEGDDLSLVITPDQEELFTLVFDWDRDARISYYASVEGMGEIHRKIDDVLVKPGDFAPYHIDNISISKGTADMLEIKNNQQIRITRIYHKTTSDVNFDQL